MSRDQRVARKRKSFDRHVHIMHSASSELLILCLDLFFLLGALPQTLVAIGSRDKDNNGVNLGDSL